MVQLRFVLCFLLVAIVAVSAITVKPLKEKSQSLIDVDDVGQGHANVGDRLVRQYGRGRGYGRGYGGYGRHRGGRYYG
ncbi:uncharacterized protein ACRADG_010632 [Cochliomyia hominivorax]